MPRTAKPKPTPDHPRLLALHPEIQPQRVDLTKDIYSIGRDASCDIVIASCTVSRVHARIRLKDLRCLLEDAPSRNGTYVNGRRIAVPTLISSGDQIGIGAPHAVLQLHDPDGTEPSNVGLHFDADQQRFFWDATALPLTPNELRLMQHLYQHRDTLCTRDSCALLIWGGVQPGPRRRSPRPHRQRPAPQTAPRRSPS